MLRISAILLDVGIVSAVTDNVRSMSEVTRHGGTCSVAAATGDGVNVLAVLPNGGNDLAVGGFSVFGGNDFAGGGRRKVLPFYLDRPPGRCILGGNIYRRELTLSVLVSRVCDFVWAYFDSSLTVE